MSQQISYSWANFDIFYFPNNEIYILYRNKSRLGKISGFAANVAILIFDFPNVYTAS